jgi:Ice-binding-like
MPRNRGWLAPVLAIAGIAALMLSGLIGGAVGTAPSMGSGASATHCGQSRVPLGAAGDFRVLAGTTITNTGATVVHGSLGLSPGSAVTGFPPGTITGQRDVTNKAAANGKAGLLNAYNNARGRTNCPTLVAGNLGGRTLGPGLYDSTSSLMISSGDLTLNAHGNRGAIFIFQIQTKFTMTAGRTVILSGGAQAANIYWVVGTSATLGTTSVLYGTILSHKSISLATGATLYGRALAQVGAVTLADNTVD